MYHHLCHGNGGFLGDGFIKIYALQSFLEGSYEYLLVWVDKLNGRLIKSSEIFP